MLIILAQISWVLGVTFEKSCVISIGLFPVLASSFWVCSVTLIFCSWKIALEAMSLSYTSLMFSFGKIEIPSWLVAGESSQTV